MTTVLAHASSGAAADAPPLRGWIAALRPLHLLALAGSVLALLIATAPVLDVDAYWHVLLGRELAAERTLDGLGSGWSFATPDSGWTTTQWLSELLMAGLWSVGGYGALSVARTVLGAAVLAALAWVVLRGADSRARTLAFLVTALPLAYAFQERPQLLSLLFLVWLGAAARDRLAGLDGPGLPLVLAVTWLWANLHGLWVMVPAVYLLVAGLRLLDDGRRARPEARHAAVTAAGALLVAMLTPAGTGLLLAPAEVAAAARGHLQEWEPTTLLPVHTWCLSGLALLVLVAWARGRRPAPWSQVVYVVALLGFGLTAYRNVPVATLLLAPVVADVLAAAFPDPPRVARAREQALLARAALALGVVGAVVVGVQLAVVPALPTGFGIDLARQLARDPGPHRVLNAYDTGGILLAFGGPGTQVAVDGRADYYGDARLDRYFDLMALRRDWRDTLAEYERFGLTDAVLLKAAPLRSELERRGWRTIAEDEHYALLRPTA